MYTRSPAPPTAHNESYPSFTPAVDRWYTAKALSLGSAAERRAAAAQAQEPVFRAYLFFHRRSERAPRSSLLLRMAAVFLCKTTISLVVSLVVFSWEDENSGKASMSASSSADPFVYLLLSLSHLSLYIYPANVYTAKYFWNLARDVVDVVKNTAVTRR